MINITNYEKLLSHFGDGQFIFKEDEVGNEMYIIGRGEVEILKKTDNGQKVLMTLKMGDVFGEMALIDDSHRSASAVAKGQTALIVINDTVFDKIVLNNPQFALKLIKVLSKRLRNSNEQIYELVSKDRKKQVLTALVNYSKEEGQKTFKGYKISIEGFIEWANSNLGYSVKDLQYLMRYLVKKEVLLKSSSSDMEIIVPEAIQTRYV